MRRMGTSGIRGQGPGEVHADEADEYIRHPKESNCAVALKPTVRAFHCTAFVFLWRVLVRDLLVVAGVIVVLVLLLAVFVEPAQTGRMRFRGCVHPFPLGMTGWGGTSGTFETRQAEPGHSPSGPAGHAGRAEDAVQRENPAFVCLALAGGTALLAGLVWMGKLRMSTSGAASAKRGAKPPPRAG